MKYTHRNVRFQTYFVMSVSFFAVSACGFLVPEGMEKNAMIIGGLFFTFLFIMLTVSNRPRKPEKSGFLHLRRVKTLPKGREFK